MPVQPLYSIGPLAQPAPPDGNHIPSHDGNARYVRGTPPGMFVAEYPQSCQRPVDITLLNSPPSSMHRPSANVVGSGAFPNRGVDEFQFADFGNFPQSARQEHTQVATSSSFDVVHQGAMSQELPIRYSTLCAQNPVNSANLFNPQARNEFHVVKEDFPALPRISVPEFPDESLQEEPRRHSPVNPGTEPVTLSGVLKRDKHDLRSFMNRWSSKEFCEAYQLLNFEDVVRRTARLHPLGECVTESVTRPLPIKDMLIGVTVANQCSQLHEPEDLRTEDSSYRIVNGHKVPVPENDKYYAMSDVLKDKLRNPRLQVMDDFTLFFQFYFFTRDVQQLAAADALFQRNWRWNKRISRWCQFERVQQQNGLQQVGVFNIYDPASCRIQSSVLPYSPQDFELCPPVIPPPPPRAASPSYGETL